MARAVPLKHNGLKSLMFEDSRPPTPSGEPRIGSPPPLARLVTRECAVEEVRSCRARLARRHSFGAPLLPPLPMLAVLVGSISAASRTSGPPAQGTRRRRSSRPPPPPAPHRRPPGDAAQA